MNKIELVKSYIMEDIKQGIIKEGQRLPACRFIAKKFGLNKITVNHAYKQLEDEHILYCIPRGGYYFVGIDSNDTATSLDVDFRTIKPDLTLIPYKAFTHAINRTIDEYKKSVFNYDTPLGLANLRETLKDRFESDGLYTPSSQIMITHGAQQGIYLALKTVFSSHSTQKLLVEIPTYSLILGMADDLMIDHIGIERTIDGINTDKLELLFKNENIKAFYIIPRHHNPTGYTLTEKNKKKIVELCYRYHVLIIEDDYLADLATDKRTLPLHYYDTNHLTFYIRSFSKTFIPGIRIGALVIPESYCDSVTKQKYSLDLCTASLPQGALDYFIKSGMYDKHIKKVNVCYKRKLLKANEILTCMSPPGLSYFIPKHGLFQWLTLPNQALVNRVSEKLAQKNIQVRTLEQNIILCIAGVPEKDIIALYTVIKIIKEEMEND